MTAEPYHKHVDNLESMLAPYAKRSFENFSPIFVDGGEIYKFYEDQWQHEPLKNRLIKRTPLQIERDRILYSDGMRKLTEKYHVLYNGQRRIVRNYVTHTMRMAQVTRAICRGLQLNSDFAEAIALGSKIGALPFVHASKGPVSSWIQNKILAIDKGAQANEPLARRAREQLPLFNEKSKIPPWIENLKSQFALERVKKFIPWAEGEDTEHGYSSGQQAYWQLNTNRYQVMAKKDCFCPETMYGIWRHTRGHFPQKDSFQHQIDIKGASSGKLQFNWSHATYEAMVVQFADDMTWIIENINDANTAALLNGKPSIYPELRNRLDSTKQLDHHLFRAISRNDSGGIYTYFINDFINHSTQILTKNSDAVYFREAIRTTGSEEYFIGCSEASENIIGQLLNFLEQNVFKEKRVANRFRMLQTLSTACVDLLYDGIEDILPKHIKERSLIEGWTQDELTVALSILNDPIHRIQASVNTFSDMGDQEIFDFVGIQAL